MKKLTILISDKGTGSNLQAIIDATKSQKINAKIVSVISDTPEAPGIKRAKINHITIKICPTKNDLLPLLKKIKPDFVVLAGWKQFITDEVIDAFQKGIINLHPGLIPDNMKSQVINPDGSIGLWNKGLLTQKAIQNFIDNKATYAGSSVHFLTKEFDFGPVLGRCIEKIRKGDTSESLYIRLKKKENALYVEVLQKLCLAKVLVIDGGGRGAALIHKYSQSKHVGELLAIPGNDLMSLNTTKALKIYPHIKTTNVKEIVNIAKRENVDLVDVAQDNAVEAGLTDQLIKAGIMAMGPTRMAGQIEWDKAWARNFMKKYKIPSPAYNVFNSAKAAKEFIDKNPNKRFFIKAAGLAEGKGAIPAENKKQAFDAIEQMSKFKKAGKTFVIEQWLEGEEFSMFAIADGKTFQIAGSAQDHKRLYNGDKGPNTGGMGCITSPLIVNESIHEQAELIIKKTINGLAAEGRPYKGVLYLGAIVVKKKVYVIEFNARWGSPEAEVLIPGIQNDIFEIAMKVATNTLKNIKIKIDAQTRIAVTGSCKTGIPDKQRKLFGLNEAIKLKGVTIYGARVKREKDTYLVTSGRLFHVVAVGNTVIDARRKAYEAMSLLNIEGDNLHYRTDIGYRDVERLKKR